MKDQTKQFRRQFRSALLLGSLTAAAVWMTACGSREVKQEPEVAAEDGPFGAYQ